MNLSQVREEIDTIDQQLVNLFLKRMDLAAEVAIAKKELGAAVTDPAREREILYKVSEAAGAENEVAIRQLFETLFAVSKARQRILLGRTSPLVDLIRAAATETKPFPAHAIVACAGTEGSYTQQAVSRLFALPTIAFFSDFEPVFDAVEKGLCPYGVLPIENSAAGSVDAVYDLMIQHRCHIVRALRLKVEHVLLAPCGTKLEDVKVVTSHPHALAQCKNFFQAHPTMTRAAGLNTAVAAKELAASGRKDAAVIASRACADLYGLEIIAENIQDAAWNNTRFICISKKLEIFPDANKFSIVMSLPHRPGSLGAIVAKFASIGVNMTKLESRPIPGMDFEFRFTFDFEASPTDPKVLALLTELSQDPEVEHLEFLGAYAEK